ncbi:isoprenyl transferase [Mycoplasmatota bacterium]|nr:isoprenyl transferase [Mycoplasmatota bacterium]
MLFKRFNKKSNIKLDISRLPKHIAFIMDGNGRWARRRGLPRTAGHNEGGKSLLKTLKACNDLGIEAMTVYAFSTENWSRPEEEVNYLMELPGRYIKNYLPKIKEANIKINFIGFIDQLSDNLKQEVDKAIDETKDNTGLIFTIALNYGSQDEIVQATKEIASACMNGAISVDQISKEYFSTKLMTYGLPDIDLLVRTSGEIRISNYLLWQIAYSELYFTKKYWPDFNEVDLRKAIFEYQKRNRRYGGLKGE